MTNTVKCNYCEWEGKEEDLILFDNEDDGGYGCPDCKTDQYLTDIIYLD